MIVRRCALGSAMAFGIGVTAVEAASLNGSPDTNQTQPSVAQHCWWRGAERHCSFGYRSRYREHGFPEHYRTGTWNWWNEMDREQRGGRR